MTAIWTKGWPICSVAVSLQYVQEQTSRPLSWPVVAVLDKWSICSLLFPLCLLSTPIPLATLSVQLHKSSCLLSCNFVDSFFSFRYIRLNLLSYKFIQTTRTISSELPWLPCQYFKTFSGAVFAIWVILSKLQLLSQTALYFQTVWWSTTIATATENYHICQILKQMNLTWLKESPLNWGRIWNLRFVVPPLLPNELLILTVLQRLTVIACRGQSDATIFSLKVSGSTSQFQLSPIS